MRQIYQWPLPPRATPRQIHKLLLLGLVAWLANSLSVVHAQQWEWSPSGTHHQAVVTVVSGNRGSSGVYVQYQDLTGVLTVAHGIVTAEATVGWSDGSRTKGPTTLDKYKHDLAFVFVRHGTIDPLQLATVSPTARARVEFLTYGGPSKNSLRHWYASVREAGEALTWYNTYVVSGDSGGAILNQHRELVGIQAYGGQKTHESRSVPSSWATYQGSGGTSLGPIRRFVARVSSSCRGGWCPVPRPRQLGPPRKFYPPGAVLPAPTPPAAQVPAIETPAIDYERLAAMVYAKLEAKLEVELKAIQGPAGPQGPPGPQGPQGSRGPSAPVADYQSILERLPALLPPVKMEIHHPDGKVFSQSKPLGEPIRIRLTPR